MRLKLCDETGSRVMGDQDAASLPTPPRMALFPTRLLLAAGMSPRGGAARGNHEGEGLPCREGGTGSGKVGRLLRPMETWRPEEHERFLDALLKSVQRHAIETCFVLLCL
jgi:hypothetical protein